MDVIVDAWTTDVGTSEDLFEAVASRTEQSWDSGADIVLFLNTPGQLCTHRQQMWRKIFNGVCCRCCSSD